MEKPPYAPNVVNQTVSYGGATWKGNPGSDWTLEGGGGGDSIDMSQVPSVQDYIKGQFASEDPALTDLVTKMMAREKPLDIYSRLETEAGLPELKGVSSSLSKEIASIEDYLTQIEPDVSARTRESLVTEAQRRGMVAEGRRPFLEKLGTVGTALGRISGRISEAERGIGTKVGLAMQGQQQELEPLQLRYTTMVDRNARMTTGFTADRQTKLDVLFDKLNRQRQLSDMEWQQASQLASEERQYTKTLQTSAANAGITLKGNETHDDILALIGKTAAEQIAYDRRKGAGGTVTEKAQATATISLRRDAQSGVVFQDLVRRYSDTIPTYKIREEYNAVNYYKKPAGESEQQVQSWQLTPQQQQSAKEAALKAKDETGGITVTRPDGTKITF